MDAEAVGRIVGSWNPSLSAVERERIGDAVMGCTDRYDLDPTLVTAVIFVESRGRPWARSPKGAMGLMQLMPGTARELAVANPFDPAQNIEGGTAYLRSLLERYAGHKNQVHRALAAYNAGPAKVDLYRGLPPYRETLDFVTRVVNQFNRLRSQTSD